MYNNLKLFITKPLLVGSCLALAIWSQLSTPAHAQADLSVTATPSSDVTVPDVTANAATSVSADVATDSATSPQIDVYEAFTKGEVSIAACQQTDRLNQILNSIAKDDVNTLVRFKEYLLVCQELLKTTRQAAQEPK